DTDNQFWCWGHNNNEQLGTGSTTEAFATPQRIEDILLRTNPVINTGHKELITD
ncbi:MAG: hypothetical protein K8963_09850, partial [Proteobacteria bacterium]|nr:hypothetical protein [Pseudomonadota bacterium]